MMNVKHAKFVVVFLFSTLAPSWVLAQSVQRESIGTLGASVYSPSAYYYDCVGQPYHTVTQESSIQVNPGFVQPVVCMESLPLAALSIKTYPNPVNRIVQVVWDDASLPTSIRVYNLQGITLQTHSAQNTSSLPLDLSEHPAGLYIVEVQQYHRVNRIAIIKH